MPGDTRKEYETACALLKQGRVPLATAILQKLASCEDSTAEIHSRLGVAYIAARRWPDAIACFRRAIRKDPAYSQAHNNLMLALYESGNLDAAAEIAIEARNLFPSDPGFVSFLSRIYMEQGNLPKTRDTLMNFINLAPPDSMAHCNLGIVYQQMGQAKQAATEFKKALAINPENTDAIRMLVWTTADGQGSECIQQYEDLLKKFLSKDKCSADVHFALGKIYENREDYKQSFAHYKAANDITAQIRNFDIDREAQNFREIKNAFPDDRLSVGRILYSPAVTPVFIVGMPRSGTTLVEQILASHPLVFGGGELTHLESSLASRVWPNGAITAEKIRSLLPEDYSDIARSYITHLETMSQGKPYVTDKMPHNFRLTGFIKAMFPNARIIHCVRDPVDCCLSIYKHYFPAPNMNFSYNLRQLGEYHNLYSDLMRHWHQVFPGGIFNVRYEELVRNQKDVTASLLSFCSLPWDDRCIEYHRTERPVSTASALQIRKPVYNTSIGSARHFDSYLAELRNVLAQGVNPAAT